jgi:hypothetical protein
VTNGATVGHDTFMKDYREGNGHVKHFVSITSPIDHDPNMTKRISLIWDDDAKTVANVRSFPKQYVYVVVKTEYAHDVTAEGNAVPFKSVRILGTFGTYLEAVDCAKRKGDDSEGSKLAYKVTVTQCLIKQAQILS